MKLWLIAIAGLLGVSVSCASADYVVIVANLGEQREIRTPGQAGQMGGIGAFGQIGGIPGGGIPGMPGGGIPGMPGRGGRGGGGIGGLGGVPGGIGGQPGGGGFGGRPGGGGFGGRPGGGAFGQIGQPGGPNTPPKPGEIEIDPDAIPLYITAIVEIQDLQRAQMQEFATKGQVAVRHHWGASNLMAYADEERLHYRSDIVKLAPLMVRYDYKHKELFNPGKEPPSTAAVKELAQWALDHGKLDQFIELMEERAKVDPKDSIVAVYLAVKNKLNAEVKAAEPTAEQLKLQQAYKLKRTVRPNDHYVIYHQSPTDDPVEVKSRADRLENNFKSFYYWFAMKGIALEMPKERLTAVLTSKPDDFNDLHKVLTAGPVVADGFFARRENVSIFSTKRTDEGYEALVNVSNPVWAGGFNRHELFKGKGYPVTAALNKRFEAEAMALLLEVMEVDEERAGISHDGARQLVYAAGLLPRNVAAPEWVQFGMGSFFETPLGSPWASTGAPNLEQLPNFRDYKKLKRFENTPGETVRKVVTDAYFRAAARGKDAAAERKARAATWALTYWLMHDKVGGTNGMLRYCKELSKQPRDVELDEDTLMACFARAFDLVDSNNSVDQHKLDDLGNQWFKSMDLVKLDMQEQVDKIRAFIAEVTKDAKDAKDKETSPGTTIDPVTGKPIVPSGPPGGPPGLPPIGPGSPGKPGLPPGRPGGPGTPP